MSPSAFLERDAPPSRDDLEEVLGKSAALWSELTTGLASEFAPLAERWSYSGKSHGWLLQLRTRGKTVVNLVPGPGRFVVSLALNEKARRAAGEVELPESARAAIREGREFPEGLGVRIEVRGRRDLASVRALASLRRAALR